MKKIKQFLVLFLTMAIALSLALPAFATSTEQKFTITGPTRTITGEDGSNKVVNDHTYEVYQIFTGKYYNGILSDVHWGKNGINNGTAVNEGDAVSEAIIDELTKLTEDNASEKTILEAIDKYVDWNSEVRGTITPENNSLSVEPGYYIIKDLGGANTGDGSSNDSYSRYILKVAADVTITPKADVPEFNKKVKDVNDSEPENTDAIQPPLNPTDWQDAADHDIGDMVDFKLSGTVADDYDYYETYKFVFHDFQSAGLTFQPDTVHVYVDGKEITEGFQTVTTGLPEGETFQVVFNDLKTIMSGETDDDGNPLPLVHKKSVITVEYQSELNNNAVIGSTGNPNTANLEFSNNPHGDGTGKTPDDTVIVFTFQTIVNKVNAELKPLDGAEFTLWKWELAADTSEGEEPGAVKWQWVSKGLFTKSGEENATFTFKGLDAGKYKLEESTTPEGYNTIDDVEFEIVAVHDENGNDPKLTKLEVKFPEGAPVEGDLDTGEVTNPLEFTVDQTAGSLTTQVVNKQGAELPSTGGIGTTIFYIAGGALVVCAGVLLVTKKRMKTETEK